MTQTPMARPPLDPTRDWIGPPDPVSRIRPIHLRRSRFETAAERDYRVQRESVQDWNHAFWSEHNAMFEKQRREFIAHQRRAMNLEADAEVPPEAMASFYRYFLNERRNSLLAYNKKWYRKQFGLLLPAVRANISRFVRLLKR